MKKRLIIVLCFMLVLSIISACGAGGPSGSQPAAQTQAQTTQAATQTQEEKITLTYWTYKVEILDRLGAFFGEFTKLNPNISVEHLQPGGAGDYYPTVAAYFASGEYPDLLTLNTENQTKQYADAGHLYPLSNYPFMKERFSEAALASVSFGGVTYTLPINAGGIGLLYNERLFERAGIKAPPATLSEFRDVCVKLQAAGINPLTIPAKDAGALVQIFSAIHAKTIKDSWAWYDEMSNGTSSFANDYTDGVFELMDMLMEFATENCYELGGTDTFALYGQEQIAMLITGAWALTPANEINPEVPGVSRMCGVPISNTPDDRLSAETSMGVGIVSYGAHIDECAKLLDWWSTTEVAKMNAENLDIMMPLTVGATVPPMGEPVWKDTLSYLSENKSYPWGYMIWITGLSGEIGSFMQEYYMGDISKAEFFKKCDDGWAKYANK